MLTVTKSQALSLYQENTFLENPRWCQNDHLPLLVAFLGSNVSGTCFLLLKFLIYLQDSMNTFLAVPHL